MLKMMVLTKPLRHFLTMLFPLNSDLQVEGKYKRSIENAFRITQVHPFAPYMSVKRDEIQLMTIL